MSASYLPLPKVSSDYPYTVDSGKVVLFADPDWSSKHQSFSTTAYVEGEQTSIIGMSLNDKASWVAFNLPVGTVMTLLQNPTVPPAGEPYNFADAGICVDLIGTGKKETVDLKQMGAEDRISALVWRRVDMNAGIFQLFDGSNFDGGRNTFFLSEWPQASVHSLDGWWINDKAASIYFGGLTVESVKLFDGGKGDGASTTVAGWLTNDDSKAKYTQGFNLNERGFGDKAASWRWDVLKPIYQVIDPFSISAVATIDDSLSILVTTSGANYGAEQTETARFTYTISQQATVTVTHSDQTTYTQSAGFTFGQSWGVQNVESTSYSVTLSFSFSEQYTETYSTTNTTTQTIGAELDLAFTAPENSNWTSALTLQFGKIPATSFSTTATYYYDQQVPNSEPDPDMADQLGYSKLFKLKVNISGYVNASLAVNAISSVIATPMGSSVSTTSSSVVAANPAPSTGT